MAAEKPQIVVQHTNAAACQVIHQMISGTCQQNVLALITGLPVSVQAVIVTMKYVDREGVQKQNTQLLPHSSGSVVYFFPADDIVVNEVSASPLGQVGETMRAN